MSNPFSTLARRTAPTGAKPDHGSRDTILASIIVGAFAIVVTFSQSTSAPALGAACDLASGVDRAICASATP